MSMTPLGLATARHLCLLPWAWPSAAILRSAEFSMQQRISDRQMSNCCSACNFAYWVPCCRIGTITALL